MGRFKVTIDGAEKEIDLPGIPTAEELTAQYVPVAVHNHQMAAARKDGQGLKKPEELLKDDAFKTQALTEWGIDPKGKAKLNAEELAQLQQQIRDKEVKPLQEQLTKAQGVITKGRQSQLHSMIESAARAANVKDEFLARPHEKAPPMIVAMFEQLFGFDDESDMWALRKGDTGYEYGTKPEHGKPWKGVTEFFAEWASSDKTKQAGFLKDVRQRVGGGGGPLSPTPSGGQKVISRDDPDAFAANLEGIAKGDVVVQ